MGLAGHATQAGALRCLAASLRAPAALGILVVEGGLCMDGRMDKD